MKDIKEYLYVMDYSDKSINEIALTEEYEDMDTENILSEYNFDIDNCSCMFTTERIIKINKV